MSTLADLGQLAEQRGIRSLPCRERDPEVMFPDETLPNDAPEVLEAKRVCLSCPLRAACLGIALDNRIDFGVWGATTEKERRAMRRKHYRHQVQDEMLEVSV